MKFLYISEFPKFLSVLISNFIRLCLENIICMIEVLFNLLRLALSPNI